MVSAFWAFLIWFIFYVLGSLAKWKLDGFLDLPWIYDFISAFLTFVFIKILLIEQGTMIWLRQLFFLMSKDLLYKNLYWKGYSCVLLVLLFVFVKSSFDALSLGNLLLLVVWTPFFEELLFRGVIYRFIEQDLGQWIALVSSSLLFGLAHLHFAKFLPMIVLGFFLAFIYQKSQFLWPSLLSHALWNAVSLSQN